MTEVWADLGIADLDGNTVLLGGHNNEHVCFCGFELFRFATEDKILDFISIMAGYMNAYTIAVGERYTSFISKQYKYI